MLAHGSAEMHPILLLVLVAVCVAAAANPCYKNAPFYRFSAYDSLVKPPSAEYPVGLNVSYAGLNILPDIDQPWQSQARNELKFVQNFDEVMLGNKAIFGSHLPTNVVSSSAFYSTVESLGNSMFNSGVPFFQGSQNIWKTDKYVSNLIANSLMAWFLTFDEEKHVFILDFTDDLETLIDPNPIQQQIQLLKKQAILAVSSTELLRSRTVLDETFNILSITVSNVTYTANDSKGKWLFAKIAVIGMGLYLKECLHTSLHVYSQAIIVAQAYSLPMDSIFNGIMDAQATLVSGKLVIQMSALHNEHFAVFSGLVWHCDINSVRNIAVAAARFFFNIDLTNFKPCNGNLFCAGGMLNFIPAILKFGNTVEVAVAAELPTYTRCFQASLFRVGLKKSPHPKYDVKVSKFLTNALFFQSVLHGSIFSTRESMLSISPPNTYTSLQRLLSFGLDDMDSNSATYDAAYPYTKKFPFLSQVLMGTVLGYPSSLLVPQLSDGPFYNVEGNSFMQAAIVDFQNGISYARSAVFAHFGSTSAFAPSFYYPLNVTIPYGYAMTHTTFI